MTTRSAARGPLPGRLLPLPRCPVLGAPRGPLPGLRPARGHPSTDSDGPSVSDPALGRSLRWEGHVFTEHTPVPLCFQPEPRGGGGGGGGGRTARPRRPPGCPGLAWSNSPWALRMPVPPAPPGGVWSSAPHWLRRGSGGLDPSAPLQWFRPAVPWSDWVANLDRLKTSAQVTADGWSWRDERRRAGNCAREPRNPRSRRHLGCSGGRREARPHPGLTSAGRTPPVRRGVPRGQPTRHRRGASAPCRPAGELQPGPPAPSGRHSVVPAGAAVPTSGHPPKLPLDLLPAPPNTTSPAESLI